MAKAIIELSEYKQLLLSKEEFSDENAQYILKHYKGKIEVEWPTPKNNNCWELVSQGWVGFIPVLDGTGINLKPKTSIENLFGMLEYAYDLESFNLLDHKWRTDSITDFFERLVRILVERTLLRIRQGLYKAYILEHSPLPYVNGRIDTNKLYESSINPFITCFYEEHTLDVEENQILMWTFYLIARSGLLQTDKTKLSVRQIERSLRNYVSVTSFKAESCINRTYNRLNNDYEILHKLCRFFLDNLGPTHELGDRGMIPFLVKMHSLFESFVGRWLTKHIDRTRYSVNLQQSLDLGDESSLKLRPDIVITDNLNNKPICVLDTKYKIGEAVSNEDYNQMIAYADAFGCRNAILIYPEYLGKPLNVKARRISVQSLTFNLDKSIEESGTEFLTNLYHILENIERSI